MEKVSIIRFLMTLVLSVLPVPFPVFAATDLSRTTTLTNGPIIALLAALLIGFTLLIFVTLRLRATKRRAREAETILKTAIENISAGFLIFDERDRLVMRNEQISRMYPSIADLFVPGAVSAELARALNASGTTTTTGEGMVQDGEGEFEVRLNDGRWIQHRDRSLPDGGTVSIRSDITGLKNRESALRESEQRYRALVERSPVAIFVHCDNVVLYANAATARILGYRNASEVLGKNIFDLIHPDNHLLAYRRVKLIEDDDRPLPQVDMKFQRADGTVVYVEDQITRIEYNGTPALESILRDITARRRTERALMESERRFRNLFELAPDAIIVHSQGNILFANAAASQMFCVNQDDDLFNVNIQTIIKEPQDCNILKADPLNIRKETGAKSCVLKRLDGRSFDAEVVSTPTNYHGEEVIQSIIRDVTKRKRLDASMMQNSKLAALGSMAAGLAHELSQPLNIMRFAAEGGMLKMSKGKADDALHTRNYNLIQDQAERMGEIMDNMRIFSRKNPGPMHDFDLTLAVRNITHLVRNPYRIEDVHIDLKGSVSGIMAHGNTIQLEQVMLNLLNNARDAILYHRSRTQIDEPGRINVACSVNPSRDTAIVSVKDNGGGIDSADLEYIFDPFFTTKEEGAGTGLGLALSFEIITSMSGTLTAHSTKDGACFTIRLPLVETKKTSTAPQTHAHSVPIAAQPNRQPDLPVPFVSRHILVVEDEIEAARAMADFLEEEGFFVSLAHNGRDGLESYRALHPDIVITDIRLPGMDGTGLIKAIRAEQPELPIIAVTGHMSSGERIDAGPGLKPVKVLQKPVSLMTLRREIDKA